MIDNIDNVAFVAFHLNFWMQLHNGDVLNVKSHIGWLTLTKSAKNAKSQESTIVMTTSRVKELESLIVCASKAYYTDGCSGIDDAVYDSWIRELRNLDENHALLSAVGTTPTGTKVKHDFIMGSLSNAMNDEEFEKWLTAIGAKSEDVFFVQPKADGISINLRYFNGVLIQALTRGDGIEGEDITANARKFKQVPHVLNDETFTGSIRGEAVLTFDDWHKIDPNESSNSRNLAAGICRRHDNSQSEFITFYAFELVEKGRDVKDDTLFRQWERIRDLGFVPLACRLLNTAEFMSFAGEVIADKANWKFGMDGLVVKINDVDRLKSFGWRGNRPVGMIAYKWEAEGQITALLDVEWQIGATGKVVPVAKLSPIRIGGVTVSSALLCNMDEINRLGVAINDSVEVIRSGEVIPKITKCAFKSDKRITIQPPTSIDGYAIARRENTSGSMSADYFIDPAYPGIAASQIMTWINKNRILGIGNEVLDALIESDLVSCIADLYTLGPYRRDVANLSVNGRRFGESRANKIIANIDAKKTMIMQQFIGSLGIPALGRRRAQLIIEADKIAALEGSLSLWFTSARGESYLRENASDLGIPGIAEKLQASLDGRKHEIIDLAKIITIIGRAKKKNAAPENGIKICFTGIRHKGDMPAGTIAVDSVASCQLLVVKDTSKESNKTKDAKKRGITVISYDEFLTKYCH